MEEKDHIPQEKNMKKWFLAVCEDKVGFMAGMFAFDTLGERLACYAAVTGLGDRAGGCSASSCCAARSSATMLRPCSAWRPGRRG